MSLSWRNGYDGHGGHDGPGEHDDDAADDGADAPSIEDGSDDASDTDNDTEEYEECLCRVREAVQRGDSAAAARWRRRAIVLRPQGVAEEDLDLVVASTETENTFRLTDDDVADLDGGFAIPRDIYDRLYPHQRQGIAWLWGLHQQEAGGILGDDMGLGKTIQVITLLRGLFAARLVKSVLIVMPKVVLTNWTNEFAKWFPDVRVIVYYNSTSARKREVAAIQKNGGVCLTTYGLARSCVKLFSVNGDYEWSYTILDEGHTIKNPSSKLTKAIKEIPSRHKLLLTGTPVQNNLRELWTLFDYVSEGELFGSYRSFARNFERPIVKAADREADDIDRQLGNKLAELLRAIFTPFFLRREKKAIFPANTPASAPLPVPPPTPSHGSLPRKKELVVWTVLKPAQLDLYRAFLETPEVAKVFNTSASPLAAIIVLRKMCNHPLLLNASTKMLRGLLSSVESASSLTSLAKYAAQQLVRQSAESQADPEKEDSFATKTNDLTRLPSLRPTEVNDLMDQSGKLSLLRFLVPNLTKAGHRVLLFSQSLVMLNLVEMLLAVQRITYLRIDGTVSDQEERQQLIDRFQRDDTIKCFLLSTEVGGIGINLTGADRVILVEPHWNPAKDAQAVDRAYRMGQTKDVIVYRLNTCGTVEEKIFRKQIFKGYLWQTATGTSASRNMRYFTRDELRDLFSLAEPYRSATHEQLVKVHGENIDLEGFDESLREHLDELSKCDIYALSDFNLLYSKLEPIRDAEGTISEQELEQMLRSLAFADPVSPPSADENKPPRHAPPATDDGDCPVKATPPPRANTPSVPAHSDTNATVVTATTAKTSADRIQPCEACRDRLSHDQLASFAACLDTPASSPPTTALRLILDALDLCEHCPMVHERACALGQELGWLS